MGPKLVAVTLGSKGVLLVKEEKSEIIHGFAVDSFWGGIPAIPYRDEVEQL